MDMSMEVSRQIRQNRETLGLSQEALAGRVFVTRQTVSNWETGKTYPDVKSLLLLSEVFGVSLDKLIKGDVDRMKEQIRQEDITGMKRARAWAFVLTIAAVATAFWLPEQLGGWGWLLWAGLAVGAVCFSLRQARMQRRFNLRTYREVVAFTQGRTLDDIERAREDGKHRYQVILACVAAAAAAAVLAVLLRPLF